MKVLGEKEFESPPAIHLDETIFFMKYIIYY